MSAAHYKLSNVVAIIDANQLQIDGRVEKIMGVEPIAAKWEAFGWNVEEVDGHNFLQLDAAVSGMEKSGNGKPNVIVARTIKGKGVSFMEGKYQYHGVAPKMDELRRAMDELGGEVIIEEDS